MLESILLFQIVVILIMIISASIKGITHIKTAEVDYSKDEECIHEVYYKETEEPS